MSDVASSPLDTMKARRDRAAELKGRIGWSWQTLADRLDLPASGGNRLSTCKLAIADRDLAWLEDVAMAVEAVPRPVAGPSDTAVARAAGTVATVRPLAGDVREVSADAAAESRGRQRELENVAGVLATVYVAALVGEDQSEVQGVRNAISAIAVRLAIVEEVKHLIAQRRQNVATEGSWQPPMPARPAPEYVDRVSF